MSGPTIKKGETVEFTQGEYSDFTTIGWFIALEEFDPKAKEAEFRQQPPGQWPHDIPTTDRYMAMLVRQGLILEINIPRRIVHAGSYGLNVEVQS